MNTKNKATTAAPRRPRPTWWADQITLNQDGSIDLGFGADGGNVPGFTVRVTDEVLTKVASRLFTVMISRCGKKAGKR